MMHYVKQFNINGVDTKQVACIELQGKPNAATEGAVGLLGIDMSSPLHEVYKCVAVNGSIYTWELLSSGLSIMSASITGGGEKTAHFPYDNLRTPIYYVVKIGDLIFDKDGYLYQIDSLGTTECVASYCGTRLVAYGMSAYDLAREQGYEGTVSEWLLDMNGSIHPYEATSTDGVAYEVTIGDIDRLYNGMTITVVPNMTSTQADITLNLNGLGAKSVRITCPDSSGNAGVLPDFDDWFSANAPMTLRYHADTDTWKSDLQKQSQQRWNVNENIGSIVLNPIKVSDLPDIASRTSWESEARYSFQFPAINSGRVYLNFDFIYKSAGHPPANNLTFEITINDNPVYETSEVSLISTEHIPIDVLQGDIIKFKMHKTSGIYTPSAYFDSGSGFDNVYLSANIETPYKYFSLLPDTTSPTEILNTLLGV